MNIYIDFDDVICETAKSFSVLAQRLFGIQVPYEKMSFFNLQQSFGLTDDEYKELMICGHYEEELLGYAETENASKIINSWLNMGHEIAIVTGRPFSAYEPSRKWLDSHGLSKLRLFCVDKYGRENFSQNSTYSLSLEELYQMKFDFAVEDSPAAFQHLEHFKGCKVAVFRRPWNENVTLPNENYVRCKDWKEVNDYLVKL